ncbi:hypothetical protein [Pseudaminobacter sp. NGMCC 1.201702]|uniref:hypothetical protein n=1 Tax=Pseudaminobacter sp. NGMCC 1.201702 TaxID=3391825 RepID=UPI0039EDF843
MMRSLFFIILLVGVAIGVVYPWAAGNFSGGEIGSWRAYDRHLGFKPVVAQLSAENAPVRVLVDVTATGLPPTLAEESAVLTLTASRGERTVLADALSFHDAGVRDVSPQARQKIYRDDAGLISEVEDGAYTFILGPGDAEGVDIDAVDLVLRGKSFVVDERAQPIGFSLMAIGAIGLVIALRRGVGGTRRNPNSQPPPRRWGRGGGEGN